MSTARRRSARGSFSTRARRSSRAASRAARRSSRAARSRGPRSVIAAKSITAGRFGALLAGAAVLLAAAPSAVAADRDPLRAAERELAADRGLYLVVTTDPPALEIKARGLTLDRLALAGVAVVLRREAGALPPGPVALPAVWRVAEAAAAEPPRRLVAPAELKPPPADGTEEASAFAAGEEEPLPEPPAEYRVGFEDGWELWVGPSLPRRGPLARFASAVADGWRALWGTGSEPPPGALALAADPATARRVHHLLRAGTPVLVAAPPNS